MPTDEPRQGILHERAPSPAELRDQLVKVVLNDLLGPAGGPEEEVNEPNVRERYLVGMLSPQQVRSSQDVLEELPLGGSTDNEEGSTEPTAPSSAPFFPSSIGMTSCVAADGTPLRVTARWGHYERHHSDRLNKLVWKRTPRSGTTKDIVLAEGELGPWSVVDEQPEVIIRGQCRRRADDWIVTLFLVNTQSEPPHGTARDTAWIFQPELSVAAADGSAVFRKRLPPRETANSDPTVLLEDQSMAMLYRHLVEFATGHGVSVHVEVDRDDQRAIRISTAVVPVAQVPKQTPPSAEEIPELTGLVLDMQELAETPRAELPSKLQALPEAYAIWLAAQQAVVPDLGDQFGDAPTEALKNCRHALERIRQGIELLGTDPLAAEAFQFANRAMWWQRTRSIFAERRRRGEGIELEEVDVPRNRSWYPFQLAFVLLNLPSLTDLHHPDRSDPTGAVAGLLWFPTGGGKTEAYLGLAAYAMALRRLQGEIEGRNGVDGVAVLMRYTLRLLTLQQFQRASALICACEVIRREGPAKWGEVPFRIGLWVGSRATPNNTLDSAEAIQQQHGQWQGAVGSRGTPVQLKHCPWCGTPIDPGRHIKVEKPDTGRGRTLMFCGDPLGRCAFSPKNSPNEGLPVLVVDEEIYHLLPAMVIATADKFAQMPWNGKVQSLFGQVSSYCPRHGYRTPDDDDADSHPRTKSGLAAVRSEARGPLRPPDLIIQDELHLISGPLGSLMGLYECAVDELCAWEVEGRRVRPKVIASTATIRRAPEQINALFLRRVEVFPPQALDIRDSFFARQRKPSDEHPGRLYFGICANGKRLKAALIRVYVAFLAASQQLYERHGAAADPWMTLVGYFNSMRELGGMRRLVEDDVRSRLIDIEKRGLARRPVVQLEELTSRKGATDIPEILDRLEVAFDGNSRSSRRSETPPPLDVLLATNMVSVGVDVKRLGLMVTCGQPKTTAEYIQASSRVGRSFPGIICTVYNWARPRDLSHYETFEHYHATFYKHVEALSVTPFAPRALDRGLSGVLVALARLADGRFNANLEAGSVELDDPIVQHAIDVIADRAAKVAADKSLGDQVRKMLKRRLDDWCKLAQIQPGGGALGYQRRGGGGTTVPLLKAPGIGPWEPFTCLHSLRDVEPGVNLVLMDLLASQDDGSVGDGDASGEDQDDR